MMRDLFRAWRQRRSFAEASHPQQIAILAPENPMALPPVRPLKAIKAGRRPRAKTVAFLRREVK